MMSVMFSLPTTCLVCVHSGAMTAHFIPSDSLTTDHDKKQCVSIRCQGYETSLAECVIYNKIDIGKRKVATATCYEPTKSGQSTDSTLFFSIGALSRLWLLCAITFWQHPLAASSTVDVINKIYFVFMFPTLAPKRGKQTPGVSRNPLPNIWLYQAFSAILSISPPHGDGLKADPLFSPVSWTDGHQLIL